MSKADCGGISFLYRKKYSTIGYYTRVTRLADTSRGKSIGSTDRNPIRHGSIRFWRELRDQCRRHLGGMAGHDAARRYNPIVRT
jgi:hypothetical protein